MADVVQLLGAYEAARDSRAATLIAPPRRDDRAPRATPDVRAPAVSGSFHRTLTRTEARRHIAALCALWASITPAASGLVSGSPDRICRARRSAGRHRTCH